jgi:hypothetical protein
MNALIPPGVEQAARSLAQCNRSEKRAAPAFFQETMAISRRSPPLGRMHRTKGRVRCYLYAETCERTKAMRGILLWAVGLPIPVIILLYLFHVI